jgi:hypothetical protein
MPNARVTFPRYLVLWMSFRYTFGAATISGRKSDLFTRDRYFIAKISTFQFLMLPWKISSLPGLSLYMTRFDFTTLNRISPNHQTPEYWVPFSAWALGWLAPSSACYSPRPFGPSERVIRVIWSQQFNIVRETLCWPVTLGVNIGSCSFVAQAEECDKLSDREQLSNWHAIVLALRNTHYRGCLSMKVTHVRTRVPPIMPQVCLIVSFYSADFWRISFDAPFHIHSLRNPSQYCSRSALRYRLSWPAQLDRWYLSPISTPLVRPF